MVGEVGADRCVVSFAQAVRACLDAAWSAADSAEDKAVRAEPGQGAVTKPLHAEAAGASTG
jgi:hypothetical protein